MEVRSGRKKSPTCGHLERIGKTAISGNENIIRPQRIQFHRVFVELLVVRERVDTRLWAFRTLWFIWIESFRYRPPVWWSLAMKKRSKGKW